MKKVVCYNWVKKIEGIRCEKRLKRPALNKPKPLIGGNWVKYVALLADMTRIWIERLSDVGIEFSMPANKLDLKHLNAFGM